MDRDPFVQSLVRFQYPERAGQNHYESYFLRLNAPTRREALWLRYTVLSRAGDPDHVVPELWCVYFPECRPPLAARQAFPTKRREYLAQPHDWITVGSHALTPLATRGAIAEPTPVHWDLQLEPGAASALVPYPYRWMYRAPFPKAKVVTPYPHCRATGTLTVGDTTVRIDGWHGSLGHNWGRAHTDQYRWAQCHHFNEHPDAFFEGAVAQLRIAGCRLPPLAYYWLRVGDHHYRFNRLRSLVNYPLPSPVPGWAFRVCNGAFTLDGRCTARAEEMVALRYDNPAGRTSTCRNSSLATLQLRLFRGHDTAGTPLHTLTSPYQAALEILTAD